MPLHIDFETASTADLKRTGAWAYAEHPSTIVLCVSWAVDGLPVRTWTPGQPIPDTVRAWITDGGDIAAWNAHFEFAIWSNVLGPRYGWPVPKLEQMHCTMARAAYWGLPMRLDDAGPALGLPVSKDTAGHRLMLQMCKPRGFDPIDGSPRWWHQEDPAKLARLVAYCEQDVIVERAVHRNTPDLPARERAVWLADQRANLRGVAVDTVLVNRLLDVTDAAKKVLDRRIAKLTGGAVKATTNAKALQGWLADQGSPVVDLKRRTVLDRLPYATGVEREALAIRADAARSSTAKLRTMLTARAADGRIRGMLQYYGAGRTGRWAGRLVQPQNFPRGGLKSAHLALDMILAGASPDDLESLFPDSALAIVAALLRMCLTAGPGRVLVAADLSQIEARMVAWLAGQDDLVRVFANREDPYCYMATRIFGRTVTKADTDLRFVGKQTVLGCGYGMGVDKFVDTCNLLATMLGMKLRVDRELGELAITAYRQANDRITRFWYACGDAAMEIAQGSQRPHDVGHVRFRRRGGSMLVDLPSGRELVYRGIDVEDDPRFGRPQITYMGVDQKTRKWSRLRTYGGKIVENITQATSRDVMADAILELERVGIPTILSVHDEDIAEVLEREGNQAMDTMLSVMSREPRWARGLPVAAEGWNGPRYRK